MAGNNRNAELRRERYQEELPVDQAKARKLLESYSHIPPGDIEPHLRAVVCGLSLPQPHGSARTDLRQREKAWDIFPYACIGRWRFLDLYITALPEYPDVLSRIKAGATFLDAGCCFGYVLRQLAADGAPPSRLVGLDLRQEYIDLGYELFRDRATFGARFLAGNMLDAADVSLAPLDGAIDIVHAASFFHLFSWADQVRLGVRLVRFFKPDAKEALVFGRQRGSCAPLARVGRDGEDLARYDHNPATLQELWDEIGKTTGTRWRVDARMDEESWGEVNRRLAIKFAIYKIG